MGLFFVMGLLATGCKSKPDSNGTMISEDGRKYGGVIERSMDKEVDTAFFSFKIDEAVQLSSFRFDDGLYRALDGETYLVLKITVKNTYERDIPMSITDFVLDFDGNKEGNKIFGYGNAELSNDEYMDEVFTLKKGESITKSILFTVKDKSQYRLGYTEYYEDQFEGNAYLVDIKPTKQ